MPTGSTNVHPHLRMTNPTRCTFMNDFVFLFSEFSAFCDFPAQCEGEAKEMGEKRRRGRETERNVRTPQPYDPYLSKAAERAATSARPEGPSEESCRNKCMRVERILRAKRASSPERAARE